MNQAMAAQVFLGILGLVVALMLFSQWRISHLSRGLRGQPAPAAARPHPQGVLYMSRCALYFAENTVHDPELLKWWHWKDRP